MGDLEYVMKGIRYTALDYAYLGVVAVVMGIIFYFTWSVYEFGKVIGGPIFARLISYGLWFIGAPLAASLIRKPLAGFLGETLGALLETLIPTLGGFTNIIYGVVQGALSEFVYAILRYKRYDVLAGALAGAMAGPGAVALDAILFESIATPDVMLLWLVAAMASGAIYGSIAASVAQYLRR